MLLPAFYFRDEFVSVDMYRGERWFRVFFFFQAEDGIRDLTVTGVQTCALPISESEVGRKAQEEIRVRESRSGRTVRVRSRCVLPFEHDGTRAAVVAGNVGIEIGRAHV